MELGDPFLGAMLARSLAMMIRTEGALAWRAVEGVGFIRGDIYNSNVPGAGGEQLSVHLWHPDLHEPTMEDSGMVHDHRFDFRSLVMVGAVHDTAVVSLAPVDDDQDAYQIHEVTLVPPVRNDEAGVRWARQTYVVTEQPQRYRLVTSHHTYRLGSTFAYPAGKFHRATVSALAVTLCWKSGQFGGGRLLARAGRKPQLAGGIERFTWDRVREIRQAAAAALDAAATLPYPQPWLPT